MVMSSHRPSVHLTYCVARVLNCVISHKTSWIGAAPKPCSAACNATAAIMALPIKSQVVDGGDRLWRRMRWWCSIIRGTGRDGLPLMCALDLFDLDVWTVSAGRPACCGPPPRHRSQRALREGDDPTISTSTPTRSALRASYRSGWVHQIAPADQRVGRESRTQWHRSPLAQRGRLP
jgi:hypothetical protein